MRSISWTVTVNRTEIQEMSRRLGLRPRRRSGTRIEWTDETWNPWVGCTEIAPECGLVAPGNPRPKGGGCYAAKQASRRLHEGHIGTAIKGEWTGELKRNTPGVWKKGGGCLRMYGWGRRSGIRNPYRSSSHCAASRHRYTSCPWNRCSRQWCPAWIWLAMIG